MAMRSLKLIGKTSNEIFALRYPSTLLDFCDFDFSAFAAGAIDVCNEALKTGTPDYDRISDLRHDIQTAHCYIEHNIRTTYEKIVFDCWIDYVCRRDNIGESGMWNRYIRCKTPFEKAIFARLCEFRYKKAINEWLNIVRVQDYAKTKLDFIFTDKVNKIEDALERRNYFDLVFSVTAREMGCRIEDLGITKIFSVGRIPTAPFMFPNISKEIVRHVLPNFDYSDDYSDIGDYTEISDQIAMDAFSRMKAGMPQDPESYNIPGGKLDKFSEKIYMPCSLKAAVDLEIDTIIEEGSWLSRCKRCKRFFLRDSEHPEEYCSRYVHNGKTCLQIYEEEHPRPTVTPQLEERCRKVTDEMYARVDKDMSLKEYDSWHLYLEAMINKVKNGEIPPADLENFLNYSLEVDISKSNPIVEVAKKEPEASKERVVKPFVPERISRRDIKAPAPAPEPDEPDAADVYDVPTRRQPKEGFFTSPAFQRQKSERQPISHIIRNGESMGDTYTKKPDPSGFTPFGAPEPQIQPQSQPRQYANSQTGENIRQSADTLSIPVREEPRRRTPREEFKRLEERIEENNRLRREQAERSRSGNGGFKPFGEPESGGFTEDYPSDREPLGYGRASERERFPQSSRERERDIRRRQSEELSKAGSYGNEPDYERLDRDQRRERFENGDREIRLNRKERPNGFERSMDYEDDGRGEPIRMNDPSRDPGESTEYKEPPKFNDLTDLKGLKDSESATDNDRGPETEEPAAPRRKVIRKNAAALSAYGKAAGTKFDTVLPERETQRTAPEEEEKISDDIDTEPFKDIGSIFDVLEQSQSGYDSHRRLTDDDLVRDDDRDERDDRKDRTRRSERDNYSDRAERDEYDDNDEYADNDDRDGYYGGRDAEEERQPRGSERSSGNRRTRSGSQRQQSVPREVTEDNVPEGIWTEERNLFPENKTKEQTADKKRPVSDGDGDDDGESAPRKHTRSNKTQRLFDVIMREPDDNPNFRK